MGVSEMYFVFDKLYQIHKAPYLIQEPLVCISIGSIQIDTKHPWNLIKYGVVECTQICKQV